MKLFYIIATLLLLHYSKADPLDEDYGYVDVRDGAHMFWVTYHTELPGDWSTHPLLLWLQGGPGSSGVGYGNFWELGPYDINGNLRDGRWTKKGNLMFIDNPVGTGYSYVDSDDLYCTDNAQIAADLVALITDVFTNYPDMQKMPFYIFAESYGGKMTADFAIALNEAIANGDITSNFQGIATGDSWISPMDSVNTWGSYLYWMGMVNTNGQAQIDAAAAATQRAVDNGNWVQATAEWSVTEGVVETVTSGVDFYNVLVEDSNSYFVPSPDDEKKYSYLEPNIRKLFFRHVMPYSKNVGDELDDFMNGEQKAHWNIPDDVVWGGQSGYVFESLRGDFMKPVVDSVAYLLNNSNIHVTVYTGDLDLICDTPGTYLWIDKMQYIQKSGYQDARREALYVSSYPNVAAYNQRFERFSVFTILRSGHMVPLDAPEMTLNMIDLITSYGNETASASPKVEVVKKLHHALKEKQTKKETEEDKKKHEAKETLHEKVEEIQAKKQENEKIKEKLTQIKHNEKDSHKAKEIHEAIKKIKEEHEQKTEEEKEKKEKLLEKLESIKDKKEEKEHVEHQIKEAVKELKEKHEEKEKSEEKEEIKKVVETIKNKNEEEEKERALKKLKLKKKMLEYKTKHAEKEAAKGAHPKSLHTETKHDSHPNSLHAEPKHDSHPNKLHTELKHDSHPNSIHAEPKHDSHPNSIHADPKHDPEFEKEVEEKLKALLQSKLSLNLKPNEQHKQ